MKKIVSSVAVFALLFACTQQENKPSDDDSGNKTVVASAIKLNKNELTIEKGSNEILTVTFTPENVADKSVTWASSDKSVVEVTDGIVVAVGVGNTEIIVKLGDLVDRCKVTVVVSAKSIMLNPDSIDLMVGDSETLTATVEPANTTDKVEWASSAESIATVKDGVVTAVAKGTVAITAKAGTRSATCDVMVIEPFKFRPVDLGLSVKWANANIGAEFEEAYGDYYAWGEVEPYYSCQDPLTWKEGKTGYYWESYKWCNGSYDALTKYNTVDDKTVLDKSDDVAHVELGDNWRMPTDAEWMELEMNCAWTWMTQNNINGRLVTAPNGNSIFLPAAGYWQGTSLYDVDSYGYYWSSSLLSSSFFSNLALGRFFGSVRVSQNNPDRRCGFSIRPVSD